MPVKAVYIDVDLTIASVEKKLYPGVASALKQMKNFGYDVYIWSASGQDNAEKIVKRYKLAKYIAGCLPKPDMLIDDSPDSLLARANVLRVTNQQRWWNDVWNYIFHKDIEGQEERSLTLPYIAAFLDGEGTICISHSKNKNYCDIGVAFYNTHREVLQKIANVFGKGCLYEVTREKRNWHVSYSLQYRQKEILKKLLSELLPWLIVKQKQAKLALAYLNTEEHTTRLELMKKMKVLNKRHPCGLEQPYTKSKTKRLRTCEKSFNTPVREEKQLDLFPVGKDPDREGKRSLK